MPNSSHKYTNRLADSSSPYLVQHSHNPVDWMPWCDEAFDLAREQGKLIFVSIGYSACHWCHVMEYQTFMDEKAAEFINEHFISIKVDREERPDVDAVYMHAVQIMTGRGGWPLSCIALPNGRPIFGGTYFPKDTFLDRLEQLVLLKNTQPKKIEEYASRLQKSVANSDLINAPKEFTYKDAAGGPWPDEICDKYLSSIKEQVDGWRESWDKDFGLSNGVPKFPLPTNLNFLLHYGSIVGDKDALAQTKLTLDAMSRGGIYDQIGGGFARYSVDSEWKIPHFEKMLYDNALLISTYSNAFQVWKNPNYKKLVFETIDFLERELRDSGGGFYSALDADSEGVEGKYYVWSSFELRNILSIEDFDFVSYVFEIDEKSYWEKGNNVLMKWQSDEDLAKGLGLSQNEFNARLQRVKLQLLKIREGRIKPGLDDKILTSWNALTVSGLCNAYRVFNEPKHLEQAIKSQNFILENAVSEDGGLFHSYHSKTGHTITGFLEDYAFTIKACIDLYEATFDSGWLYKAQDLLNYSFEKFYDVDMGTFWFTSSNSAELFARKQENDDSVIPSSNSIMAMNMFKLGRYFSRFNWVSRSDRMLAATWEKSLNIRRATNWGQILLWRSCPFYEIAITAKDENDLGLTRQSFDEIFLPQVLVSAGGFKSSFPKILEGKSGGNSQEKSVQIFICKEGSCSTPFDTTTDAVKELNLKK